MSPVAVITGCTGQDGSYLTELLLEQGYHVKCIVRNTTYPLTVSNIGSYVNNSCLEIFTADLLDQSSLNKVFLTCMDTDKLEVYNLAAQSHVGVSFDCPINTMEVNSMGVLNILETIRQLGLIKKCRFYQASTSEMFGKVHEVPQNENTPFHPRSPYGVSKLSAHWIVKNYRETYDMYACCGILFNHESPRRGDNFVTQKIVKGIRNVLNGKQDCLYIGNVEAKRDWGHARDYVYGMWLMMQQDNPDDYVISMNQNHSVREFIAQVMTHYPNSEYKWEDEGDNEKLVVEGKAIIKVSKDFYRPCEVETLLGDSTKIRNIGWKPQYTFNDLVDDMVISAR